MRRLNAERQLTFLIVTHDPSVGGKSDRIVRMLDGRVIADERPGARATDASELAVSLT
jgi:ABC-type lipoprotein export system ATPase subunit